MWNSWRRLSFAAVVVVTIALGIGASTAVFSAVDALLLRPFPIPDGDRIVILEQAVAPGGSGKSQRILPTLWQANAPCFEGVEQYVVASLKVSRGNVETTMPATLVGPGFLSFLHLRPRLGRMFTTDEAAQGGPNVAMLGYDLWSVGFGGATDVLGRSIRVEDRSYVIVGVMPEELTHLPVNGQSQVWLPLRGDALSGLGTTFADASIVARLRSGLSVAEAERELDRFRLDAPQVPPEQRLVHTRLLRPQQLIGQSLRTSLTVLFTAALLLLLIAYVNAATLQVIRGHEQAHTTAIRYALGASRGAQIRGAVLEGALYAVIGGLLGLMFTRIAVAAVARSHPTNLQALERIGFNDRVFAFGAGAALLSSISAALAPAVRAARTQPAQLLREDSLGTRRSAFVRRVLMVMEVGISVVLLTSAVVFGRAALSLALADSGFDAMHTLIVSLAPAASASMPTVRELERSLEPKVRRIPGVLEVAVAEETPLQYAQAAAMPLIDGRPVLPTPSSSIIEALARTSPEYFHTLGIPILAGRTFSQEEADGAYPAVIVGEKLALRLVAGGQVVGHYFQGAPNAPPSRIVGVARNVAAFGLRSQVDGMQLYEPLGAKSARHAVSLVVRIADGHDPMKLGTTMRSAIASSAPTTVVEHIESGTALLHHERAGPLFYAGFLSIFAALALGLTGLGVFSVLHRLIQQRQHEIAIRMAIGANSVAIARWLLREVAVTVLLGLAGGILSAVAVLRVAHGFIYAFPLLDAQAIFVISLIVGGVALTGSSLPLRRAVRMDPLQTLRSV